VRCAFDAKFHLTFRIPSRPKPGRRNHPISGALVQQPDSFTPNEAIFLRHEKDFVGVGIFHFGSRWEPADINIALIRCIGAGNKSGFIRHRNAIREIALGRPRGRGSGGFRWRILLGSRWRRRGLVRIVGLRDRLLFGRIWITRDAMTHWRLFVSAGYKDKTAQKNEPR
jgi:hypothetical protein